MLTSSASTNCSGLAPIPPVPAVAAAVEHVVGRVLDQDLAQLGLELLQVEDPGMADQPAPALAPVEAVREGGAVARDQEALRRAGPCRAT